MPKINVDSAVRTSPRVAVGWTKGGRNVQVIVEGAAARLDEDGLTRLDEALKQARREAFGGGVTVRITGPRPPRPDAISRRHDMDQVLA